MLGASSSATQSKLPANRWPQATHLARSSSAIARSVHWICSSSSGWDLWQAFGDSVERTSDRLVRWWAEPFSAKAVLILDGLSLRELPWLLQGAKERGFTTHEVAACASELPGETDEFARALGFSSRSRLQNNGGGLAHKLQAANTETMDLPWRDCEALIGSAPNQIFWHHWPDAKLHDIAGQGQGLEPLTKTLPSN